MAEIKIEKKKPVWPWILVAALIIALLIFFLAMPDDDDEYEMVDETTVVVAKGVTDLQNIREENAQVIAFDEWLNANMGRMDLDHEFTHRAITNLVEATRAMAAEIDFDVEAELSETKQWADEIMKDPYKTSHADKIRKATDLLSRALLNMQESKYPGLEQEAQKVKIASTAIKPAELTLDQKEEVKGFFREASDLLKKMN